ncbi:MAG: glycosyltransferase family 4 protein [Cyclobacteriaceae bacterium]
MDIQPEILVISHKFPPSIGGMQKHCYELVEGISKKTKVHRLIQTEGISKIGFFLTVVAKARRILKANPNISLIYVNDGLMAFVLSKLLKHTKVPMVATIHGLDVVFPMKFYQNWVRNKLAKYAGIIAVSEATENECLDRGLERERVFMVKNGFEPETMEKRDLSHIREKLKSDYQVNLDGKKVIVSIGRGVKRKGFSWFIRNVVKNLPEDVCYLMIGPSANTKQIRLLRSILPASLFEKIVLFAGLAVDDVEIEAAIKELCLDDRVKRISGLKYSELNDLVRSADISVMPNLSIPGDFEGFGLVALEAVSNGTLCIAAGIEGITTAIEDGKNGVLLESRNPEIWKNKIESFLDKPDELIALSGQYQKYNLEHSFSWSQMVDAYYDIFVKIAGQKTMSE